MYQLIHGDCLDVLPTLEAGSIDAVITDPPYGIGITRSPRIAVSRGMGGGTWDDAPADAKTIRRLLALNVTTVIWGGNYFDLPSTRCVLVWDKKNDGRDFADLEMAWTNINGVARIFRHTPILMDGGKVHPTQKPIALMRWCIRHATKPGDVILDPFMGSGSTIVAAIMEGRNAIGIEIDKGYYDIAVKRCADAAAQPRLLDVEPEPKATQTALMGF